MTKNLIPAVLTAFLFTGCSFSGLMPHADAPRYYILTSSASTASIPESRMRISMMPVHLPGYLDRAQIVTRSGEDTAISVSDYDRWGEDLALGIARVVSAALSEHGISAAPLRLGMIQGPKLRLEIRRFEGIPGGNAEIDAGWTLIVNGDEWKTGSFAKHSAAGSGYEGMVASLSLLAHDLGSAIAASLR